MDVEAAVDGAQRSRGVSGRIARARLLTTRVLRKRDGELVTKRCEGPGHRSHLASIARVNQPGQTSRGLRQNKTTAKTGLTPDYLSSSSCMKGSERRDSSHPANTGGTWCTGGARRLADPREHVRALSSRARSGSRRARNRGRPAAGGRAETCERRPTVGARGDASTEKKVAHLPSSAARGNGRRRRRRHGRSREGKRERERKRERKRWSGVRPRRRRRRGGGARRRRRADGPRRKRLAARVAHRDGERVVHARADHGLADPRISIVAPIGAPTVVNQKLAYGSAGSKSDERTPACC